MFEKADAFLFSFPWPVTPLVILAVMVAIGVLSHASRKLTASGALAAVLLGFSVMWGLRIEGIVLFLAFFVLSNLAGKLRKRQYSYGRKVDTKEGARDWAQVFPVFREPCFSCNVRRGGSRGVLRYHGR